MRKNQTLATFFVTIILLFNVTSVFAESIEEEFIESTYAITYEETLDFFEELEVEYNIQSSSQNKDEKPKSFSYDSDQLVDLMEDKYGKIVNTDYLEKLIINGDLMEMYYLSLENKADYSVDNVELLNEEIDNNFIKQDVTFTLEEQLMDKEQVEQSWDLKATISRSKETDKIIYFSLESKPYIEKEAARK